MTARTIFLDATARRGVACSYAVAALPAVPKEPAGGGPIPVGGSKFARGLRVTAPSRVEYRLDGDYARFHAWVGVDDAARFQGSVVFAVEVDGVERYRSGVVRGEGGGPLRVRVPIEGAQKLGLVVEDAGDGTDGDLADWGEARLVALATFPLERAHAHDDYRHARPLLDALDHGFTSVEADVFLADGNLLGGHDRSELKLDRTLEALHLDPLLERSRKNGGHVHRKGGDFILLVDMKTDGAAVYAALRELLLGYSEMLTVFRGDSIERRAVTVILSGDRPRALLEREEERLAALDGRPPDLDAPTPAPASRIPLVSQNWRLLFPWSGSGGMPEPQRQALPAIVERAHAQGRTVRFWGTPESRDVWRELLEAGVDLINTDDLDGLERFLRN